MTQEYEDTIINRASKRKDQSIQLTNFIMKLTKLRNDFDDGWIAEKEMPNKILDIITEEIFDLTGISSQEILIKRVSSGSCTGETCIQ